MSKFTKLILGIATIWPAIYIFLFIAFIIGLVAFSTGSPDGSRDADPIFAIVIVAVFALHIFTIILSMGLTVFYIVHVIKNEVIKNDMKAVWAVLFFFLGIFAEPVYWYLRIWKEPVSETPIGQLPSQPASDWFRPEDARQWADNPPTEPPDWR